MFDGKAFGEEIVSVIKSHLDKELNAIKEQINALGKRIDELPPALNVVGLHSMLENDFAAIRTLAKAAPNEASIRGWIAEAIAAIPPIELPEIKELDLSDIELKPEPEDIRPIVLEELGKAMAALPTPKDGEDGVTLDECKAFIINTINDAIKALPPPKDGTSVTIEDCMPIIHEAVKALPPHKDGKSVTVEDIRPVLIEEVTKAVAALPPPKDGTSVTIEDCMPIIHEAVKALPPPKDGKSVTVEDIRSVLIEEVTKAVAALPPPKDGENGVGVAGSIIDRKGHLLLTLSNGTVQDLGPVLGKDADVENLYKLIDEKFEAMPKPKDGVDGLGFDDMSAELREDGLYLVWEKGDMIKEALIPSIIYKDVWKDGVKYVLGNAVTWGGSLWIAKKDNPEGRPDLGKDWKLAVKKGKDGKEIVKVDPNAGK